MEVGAVDRVSVVDKESRDLVGIAGRLRKALGGPAGAWVLGDAGVDDRASAEGENDEDVKDTESTRDEDEEVAGPGLVQVVADEGSPALATLSVQTRRAVLGDGARGDLVAELGQFGGDDLLTPGRVLAPHPPDEFSEICIDGRTARRTVGAPAPEQGPGGTVPADDGLGFHEEHGVQQAVEAAGQRTDEPAIESAQARAFDLAADHDELLAKDQVFGDQGCPGDDPGQDEAEQEAKEADHGSDRVPRWSVSGTAGVRRAGQDGRTRGGRGSGPATAPSPSAKPEQIQRTTEY